MLNFQQLKCLSIKQKKKSLTKKTKKSIINLGKSSKPHQPEPVNEITKLKEKVKYQEAQISN